jgi:hypothetical protein
MANKFQIKRTSVSGRTPNTTNVSNTSYIDAGELAVNLVDHKLFTSNGSAYFEVGSNLSTLTVSSIVANGVTGNAGQVLATNGSNVYWTAQTGGGSGSNSLKVYTYNITTNTTVITGADANSNTLLYTSGLESVFVNGVRLTGANDYTRTDTSTITLSSNAVNGDVVEVMAFNPITILDGANSATTVSTANTIVDSFPKATYRTAKYYIQISSNSQYHASEVLLIHNNANVFFTEYAVISSNNSLGIVSANVNGANIDLLVAPTYANSTINIKRITLEV